MKSGTAVSTSVCATTSLFSPSADFPSATPSRLICSREWIERSFRQLKRLSRKPIHNNKDILSGSPNNMTSEQDSEQLKEDFQLWYRRYTAALQRMKSDRICMYSPAYDQHFDPIWDSLNQIGVPCDPPNSGKGSHDPVTLPKWLQDIRQQVEGKITRRRQRYSTWAEDSPDWKACPLWLHLCRFDGSAAQIQEDEWRRPEFPWLLTLEYWLKFQQLMEDEGFHSTLSPPQQCSYQVRECYLYTMRLLIYMIPIS